MKISQYIADSETSPSAEGFVLMAVLQPDGSYLTKAIASDNLGARGAQGVKGDQGAPGVNGTNGVNGSNGAAGAAGATGATGATGPAGSSTHSTLTYAASVALDLTGDDFKTVALAGDIIFTTTNKSSIKFLTVRIVGDGSDRAFTFPGGWTFIGSAAPTALTANKVGVLSITCYGTADTDIVAAYAAQP